MKPSTAEGFLVLAVLECSLKGYELPYRVGASGFERPSHCSSGLIADGHVCVACRERNCA